MLKTCSAVTTILMLGGLAWAGAGGQPAVQTYHVTLDSLNDSGVTGFAELTLKGKQLTVYVEAAGFEPGVPHPQHIHGFNDPKSDGGCPPSEADVNGDGVIDVGEGAPYYGPVLLPLEPFNLVDAEGNLSYEMTFEIQPQNLKPLHFRTMVLHGLTVGDAYVPSLPVACGTIEKIEPDESDE